MKPDLTPIRRQSETFAQYVKRRANGNHYVKWRQRLGMPFHNTAVFGTYRRSDGPNYNRKSVRRKAA